MDIGLQKMNEEGRELDRIDSFLVIGDPGCDGLGADTMSLYARALGAGTPDFALVVGDLVPYGSRQLYRNVVAFTDTASRGPVYVLPGNHDTDHYEEFFGRGDYWLAGSGILLIVLDNARRNFSEESMAFLKRTLSGRKEEHIVLFFHIPPPNPVSGNSISEEIWKGFLETIGTHRDRVRYIVCGHLHGYFESESEGIPLIVTGGAGARIEEIGAKVDPALAYHHVVEFRTRPEGGLLHTYLPITDVPYDECGDDAKLRNLAEEAFRGECEARVKYELSADDFLLRGYPGIAALLRAASDAEGVHARNHLRVLEGWVSPKEALERSISSERHEVDSLYAESESYAEERGAALARYAFGDAREAERIHLGLLEEALNSLEDGRDIPEHSYWTCSSCGQTFRGDDAPGRCPVCGAPHDKIRKA